MKRYFGISLACFCSLLLVAGVVLAKPTTSTHEWAVEEFDVDVVGNLDGTPVVSKAAQDTIWIATWTFDGACTNAFSDDSSVGEQIPGWFRDDIRILNDGNVYWQTQNRFAGALVDSVNGLPVNIVGNAAVLTNHDLCWGFPDGYGNNWYQAICIRYVGDSYLSFNALIDSEAGFDFYSVETDSACASASFVNYDSDPEGTAASFRDEVTAASGFGGIVADSLFLTGYGTADTHCVYIAFLEDGAFNQEDGNQPTINGAALVVDDIVLEGAYPSSENYDGGATGEPVSYANLQDGTAFGTWMRVFQGISDNDICSANNTCAWFDTDHTNPTVANASSQSFGPGTFVMKNWRDTTVIGPWVSLASTPTAVGTLLQFRRFPGNFFSTSRAVQNWSVRGRTRISNTDTAILGDSIDCVSAWGHSFQWNSLSLYSWVTSLFNMSSNFSSSSREVQIRFRNSDWRWITGASPPVPFQPGPGPYWDRVQIGRQVLTGPVINEGIDARYQAQDCAPTGPNESGVFLAPGFAQTGQSIFETAAFSRSTDLGINSACILTNLIVGDSTTIIVQDVRNAGGIASVNWYGCIVSGPHAGKAPPGFSVGANGFFCIPADTSYTAGGAPSPGNWAIDMDDQYFRGGDTVRYFWLAEDNGGGFTSNPVGLSGPPADLAAAEAATGGLFEVNYLPTIDWAASYLAKVAVSNNVEPDSTDLANSSQKNCILYYQHLNSRRRSGLANRTTFMASLDAAGYQGSYDVYDHTGLGNTNNALGSRMTVEQAAGYSLIIMDAGNRGPGAPIIPSSIGCDAEKINQDQWFTDWVTDATPGNPEHTLWVMGSNVSEEGYAVSFFATAGVVHQADDQATNVNPAVVGQQLATINGANVNSPLVTYALDGGCAVVRNYDALTPAGGAIETHTYDNDGIGAVAPGSGKGAIIMRELTITPGNTIVSSHPWGDIRDFGPPTDPEDEMVLLLQVLAAALPAQCEEGIDPVDVPGDDQVSAAPAKTTLHQNYPNPFNPVTKITFDLARDGQVSLNVYDVAGRLVRTLVNEKLTARSGHEAVWNGLDNKGNRVSSGVYFYRLVAGDFTQTNKMVLMK